MMAIRWSDDGDREFSLPLTPMIDVVFLLIIFFLTSTVLKRDAIVEEHVKIDLPRASANAPVAPSGRKPFSILIDADGNIASSASPKKILDEVQLREILLEYRQQGHDSIVIRSDRKSEFDVPARVIRLAGEVGLNVMIGYRHAGADSATSP